MWISKLRLQNIRSFVFSEIELSPKINILIGANNSGKSTLLSSILHLRQDHFTPNDLRINEPKGSIKLFTENCQEYFDPNRPVIGFDFLRNLSRRYAFTRSEDSGIDMGVIPSIEPNNLIYPYLSRRKVGGYQEIINEATSNAVSGNLEYIYAKIDRLTNKHFQPAHEMFENACKDILGFPITTVPSTNGKRAAYIIKNFDHIPLTSMGEGVANLLGLIVDLCVAENKIFLIEEPENDIHPKALKALLALIQKKSENNRFIISTHSNIVTKYLGADTSTKIFKVSMKFDESMPVSEVKEVGNSKTDRQEVLEELGYEFYDYDLWKAWLFFEEASAEGIVRDFLIPKFTPSLQNKLKTFSASGVDKMRLKFDDFNNLFVFLHLESIYKNKAWVVVDSGTNEEKIIHELKQRYSKTGWNEDNFRQLRQHDFERYYPKTFSPKVDAVLAITDKTQKRDDKKKLLLELKQWYTENPDQAKTEFIESAKEIINLLKEIEQSIRE